METSTEVKELFTGMFALKGKLQQPKFDGAVDYSNKNGSKTKFKYATLAAVEAAIRTAAQESKSGIDFQQEVINENNKLSVITLIYHTSGQWIKHGPFDFPNSGSNPQSLGSLATYARRYSLSAAFGIAADDDDDAQTADDNQKQNANQQQNNKPIYINGRQLAELKQQAQAVAEISGAQPDAVLGELSRVMHIQSADQIETKDLPGAKKQLNDWKIFYENQRKAEEQSTNQNITWGQ